MTGALSHLRICDFTGQLAGAGATKWLAAFGAEVIRIEDPVRQGRWDILRGMAPFIDERRGIDMGGAFNNHNTNKLGITLNLRTDKGKEILRELVSVSDAVTENFAAGVLDRWGFSYEQLKDIREDIVYVSNCGFGHKGPYAAFKTWGPIVQAVSGLTHSSGLPEQPPAGWGYSYMDHTGAYYMAIAIMMALHHRDKTGEGQWVDLACTEAGLSLNGPALLDWTVNGRGMRDQNVHSNREQFGRMAPHGVYSCKGDDHWLALACKTDEDWRQLSVFIGEDWCDQFVDLSARLDKQDLLDERLNTFTAQFEKYELQKALRAIGLPASAVQKPGERVDKDTTTAAFGLWPEVTHTQIGNVRVDGEPVHLSGTDWTIDKGGPCLGEHNEEVLTRLLGYSSDEVAALTEEGVL